MASLSDVYINLDSISQEKNTTIKETQDVIMIYGDNRPYKSIVCDKNKKPIYCNDNIIYDGDIDDLKDKELIIQESFEGTTLVIYWENKWHVSTRRCIDSSKSKWGNENYDDLLHSISDNLYDHLDKSFCYYFSLIHPLNENIMTFDGMKCLVHYMTRKKYTYEEIELGDDHDLYKDGQIIKPKKYSYDEINDVFDNMNKENAINDGVKHEGLVIRYFEDGVCKIRKKQTHKYKKIKEIKPNSSSIQKCYLEMFKNNQLTDYLNLCTNKNAKEKSDIIMRLSNTMVGLSRELSQLYFKTRRKNNKHIYDTLTPCYKHLLYELHGIYIANNRVNLDVSIVYKYLYNLDIQTLCIFMQDRKRLLEEGVYFYANKNNDIDITTSLIKF